MLSLAIFIVSLLAVSTVCAANNTTNDVVSVENIDEISSVDNNSNDIVGVEENTSKISGNDYGNAETPFTPVDEFGNPIYFNDDDVDIDEDSDIDDEKTYKSISMTSSFTTTYDGKIPYELCCDWVGYFNGYFKVYKGSSCVFNKHVKGYDKEYSWYPTFKWNVGTYKAYIYDINGEEIFSQKYVIKKEPTKISIKKSWNVKPGKEINIYGKLLNRGGDRIYDNLKVNLKINGKTYRCQLNAGYIDLWFNAPKKTKTYTAKIIVTGTKNFIASSKTFKITVKSTTTKKKSTSQYKIITTSAKQYWITKYSGKFTVKTKIWDMTAGFRAPYKYIDTTLYKNGKQLANGKYSVNYKINGKWTGWAKYGTTSTAHHRYMVYDSARVDQIKVKVHK